MERYKAVWILFVLLVLGIPIGVIAHKVQRDFAQKTTDAALIRAVVSNNGDAARAALKQGADPDAHDEDNTPLKSAVTSIHPQMVRLLIQAGCKVDALDTSGLAPLHYAVQSNNAECVQLLIAAGADVNAGSRQGYTPLDFANRTEIARILRKAGAISGYHIPRE